MESIIFFTLLLPLSNKNIKAFQTQGAEIKSSNTNQLSVDQSILSSGTRITKVSSERKSENLIEDKYTSDNEERDDGSSKERLSLSTVDPFQNDDSFIVQITYMGETMHFRATDQSDEEQKVVSIRFLITKMDFIII